MAEKGIISREANKESSNLASSSPAVIGVGGNLSSYPATGSRTKTLHLSRRTPGRTRHLNLQQILPASTDRARISEPALVCSQSICNWGVHKLSNFVSHCDGVSGTVNLR